MPTRVCFMCDGKGEVVIPHLFSWLWQKKEKCPACKGTGRRQIALMRNTFIRYATKPSPQPSESRHEVAREDSGAGFVTGLAVGAMVSLVRTDDNSALEKEAVAADLKDGGGGSGGGGASGSFDEPQTEAEDSGGEPGAEATESTTPESESTPSGGE